MPHIIVEHSINDISHQQTNDLLLAINQTISATEGNFDIGACKARAINYNNFVVADGKTNHNFMHISVMILEGRDIKIRKTLAENLIKMVGKFLQNNNLSQKVDLSVDISELIKEIYQKTTV